MTVAEAKKHCLTLKGCQGFSFNGKDMGRPMEIHFKSKWALSAGEGWTSYMVEPKPGVVTVAPHLNTLDAAVMAYCFPPVPAEVGKKELISPPLGYVIGPLATAGQGIFVSRENKLSREACKEAIAERAEPNWTGPPTLLFPEGTCTNGRVLIQFKAGAFLPGKPVLPVALKYPYKHFEIAWTGVFAFNMGMLIIRCMLQFVNHCEVVIFPAYVPNDDEVKDSNLFAKNVRALIAGELDVPTTEHSYGDAAFSLKALKAGVASDFTFEEVANDFGLTGKTLESYLASFKEFDKDHSGFISETEFTAVLAKGSGAMTDPKVIRRLFELFNTDGSGQLSYRECIQALTLILDERDLEGKYRICFLLTNPGDDGLVKKHALENVVADSWPEGATTTLKQMLADCPDEVSLILFRALAEKHPALMEACLHMLPESFRPPPKSGTASLAAGDIELADVPKST